MLASDIPALPRGVRLHRDRVRGTWVLLAPERAVTLDQIGHAILSEVDGHRSFGEITQALADRYSAPVEQIRDDSASFLTALRNRRFLDVTP
ncbi:pyrroloquinoline quinone biosynthesis peptide chaperone PqqD [uncultured Roseobacter sp.]|uniref:pyrroloquinoline quinone biosynthesis peptide chaperone PqqD n=1 Tax=uncultured Roseobacter sp. TaxID=114847 RepID=UPI002628872C|nr:pyrroloquinoline quinone biosynthesis peptide chaperone PqqD [uncultured Roseobacter sp.]